MIELKNRPRRNRKNQSIRNLVQEHHIHPYDFIMPMFIKDSLDQKEEITSMPGIYRHTENSILFEIEKLMTLGIQGIVLFPVIPNNLKNPKATEALNSKGIYPNTIHKIKKEFPGLTLITDIALDPYSSDGHDGLVSPNGEILNDESIEIFTKMALIHANAGADIVAPSDMMDGRIQYIRENLDQQGFQNTSILSYAAKFASSYYGPFREALDSAPKNGDKKTYQLNPSNSNEALREILDDIQQNADILMIKPALAYLDIIYRAKELTHLPIAVYNVSGEYSILQAAAKNGWIDYQSAVLENMISFKRSGADIIFSYHAKEVCQWLHK